MSNLTKAGTGHGAQFDRFTRQPRNPHGARSDENYGNKSPADVEFERQLAAVPPGVRNLSAGCPSCGHRHTLADALRAARNTLTGKSRRSDIDVQKSAEPFVRSGAGEPDDLHEALVANIRRTYGIR